MKERTLEVVKEEYKGVLELYLKQEKWIETNEDKVTQVIMNKFSGTVAKLGELGWELEDDFGVKMTLEEKLGKVGTFAEEVLTQLNI